MILGKYKNLSNMLNEVGALLRDEYKDKLKEKNSLGRNAIATGTLYNSVRYEIKSDDNYIYLYLNLADHWVRVEYDQIFTDKTPPVSKIRSWMVTKKINFGKGGEYKIANSIKRKGIKGRHFLEKTIKEFKQSDWQTKLNEALQKDVEEIFNNKIKEINKTLNKK